MEKNIQTEKDNTSKRESTFSKWEQNPNEPELGVEEKTLENAARATLAIEKAVLAENLDVIAVEDLNVEMLELLKARPHLWTKTLSERKTIVTMEADVISAIGMWAAQRLSGEPTMYAEAFNFDEADNALLMGHATMHNTALAGENPITIIPDKEYENTLNEGAWLNFNAKPGRVLLCNTFADVDNYRIFTSRGTALPYNKLKNGFTSVMIKLDVPVREFYEKAVRLGMTQHNTICYGDVEESLRLFCEITNIEYISCEG